MKFKCQHAFVDLLIFGTNINIDETECRTENKHIYTLEVVGKH